MSLRSPLLDDPLRIRSADAGLLSLALIDARNLTLRWLEVFERRGLDGNAEHGHSVRWLAGHAGWYQEFWLARHVQRSRGPHCDAGAPRLASIEPQADRWFARSGEGPPDATAVRGYLAETLDTTLDLLSTLEPHSPDDDAMHFFRAALLHEDRLAQALAERAALQQLGPTPDPPPPLRPMPVRTEREALWVPSQTLVLGQRLDEPILGYLPDNERGHESVTVPDFEIDAQAVSWGRFIEFAEDGGYDRSDLWTVDGWAWVQDQGRRAPRDVEQLRGGVLVQRQGALQRAPLGQPVMHLSRHEAQAWCHWAGRRLPTEPEWALAARAARSRGFIWGDVFEWVAGSARGWPGQFDTPGSLDRMPTPASQGVLRGASFMTPPRAAHPQARRFLPPDADHAFCGFRSCAV